MIFFVYWHQLCHIAEKAKAVVGTLHHEGSILYQVYKVMIHLLSGFWSVLYTVIALSRFAAYIFSFQAPSWEDWWILKPSSSNWVPHRFEFLHSSSVSMFLSSTSHWYYACLNFYADKFVELVVGVQTRYTYISGSWGG